MLTKSSLSQKENNPIRGREHLYSVSKKLGTGEFGAVFELVRIKDGSKFATKQISMVDQDDQKLFLSETATMSRLKHINIVCLEDFWLDVSDDGAINGHLLLEWCDSDLDKIWRSVKQTSGVREKNESPFLDKNGEGVIILEDYLAQALNGLAYMHSNGVVHSDIKPANIFVKIVNGCEIIKFGDFGMAKFGFGTKILASKLAGGTSAYQPPELNQPGAQPATSTDIYSLAVTMWQLATFEYPGVSAALQLAQGYASERVRSAINAMLCPDPKARPSATDLLLSLKATVSFPFVK
jgi:serine/threonine protein kinase